MCGILGSFNLHFDQTSLDLISHRGPDFGQIKTFKTGDDTLIFGHRRLSILDLSAAANQPMMSENEDYSIIFNGEIYNHSDLREQLDKVEFKTHSDTETLLHFLIHNGMEELNQLNGIFAFAFYDKIKQKLFLVRDCFGVKPLYYHFSENGFVFSSEIRPIKHLISTSLDKDSLSELLKLRYVASEDTLHKEIKKLLPGHFLEFNLKTRQIDIQNFNKQVPGTKEMNLNSAIHRYGDLFEKAVKRQLMSDVDLGVLLSGGIDSALVTHFTVKNSQKPIKSFTVGFVDEDESNELTDARNSANILGTQHHEVVIDQNDFQNVMEEVFRIVEEPLGTTSSIPMYFLNKEVSKHVKVVLTGQGADEPLGGYARYKSEYYRHFVPSFVLKSLQPFSSYFKNEKMRRFIFSAVERDVVRRFEKAYTIFNDDEIFALTGQKENRAYRKINYFYKLLGAENLKPVEAMMAIDMRLNLADDLLIYTDKVSLNFAVETRVPILDLELIDFIQSLPLKYKIKNGKGKFIHTEFAKSVLPSEIVNRTKKGFKSPTNKWFNQSLGDLIIKITEDKDSEFLQIFKKDEILKVLKLHKEGHHRDKQLFLILSLYYWLKNANLRADILND